jgi:hypothetical protein
VSWSDANIYLSDDITLPYHNENKTTEFADPQAQGTDQENSDRGSSPHNADHTTELCALGTTATNWLEELAAETVGG